MYSNDQKNEVTTPDVNNPGIGKLKLVEKYKIWYSISAAIALIGIVFMIIFGAMGQGALNFGIDFTGGTKLEIFVGNEFSEKKAEITEYVLDDLAALGATDHDAVQYTKRDGIETGISVTFRLPEGVEMDEITPHFTNTSDTDEGGNAFYAGLVQIMEGTEFDSTDLKISPQSISAKASGNLLMTTVLSLIVAVFAILIYITIRFEMLSGFIAVLALVHDSIIICCVMAIFRIPVNSPFIAALITIIGYSINATIVIFDRMRENCKKLSLKQFTPTEIANLSIRETMTRSINTTITTLFTIVVLACFPIPDLQYFAIPIIVGLIAGTFSSVSLAGTSWALIRERREKRKAKSAYQLAQSK